MIAYQDTGFRVSEPYAPIWATTLIALCFFKVLLIALNLHRIELNGFSKM